MQKVIIIQSNCMIKCQMTFYVDKCQVLHITKNSSIALTTSIVCSNDVFLFWKEIEESLWAVFVKMWFLLKISSECFKVVQKQYLLGIVRKVTENTGKNTVLSKSIEHPCCDLPPHIGHSWIARKCRKVQQ